MNDNKNFIERVFNLGDYKSLRIGVVDTEEPDVVRDAQAIERILDAYMTYFMHQKIANELVGNDTTSWQEKIDRVNELREFYREQLSNMEK